MKNSLIIVVVLLLSISFFSLRKAEKQTAYTDFVIPKGWPKPVYDFKNNKLTEEGFELGRSLFYDPLLSRDSTISCASCHLQYTGFAHTDHALSHGIDGKIGTRNAMPIVNLAWTKLFHWDGGVTSLEVQPINPITNPLEMDNTLPNVLTKLKQSLKYKKMFYRAFGDSIPTTKTLLKAITQFTVALESSNSKFDKVMRHEKGVFFTEQEGNGFELFKKNCASCHRDPLFTNDRFADNGLPLDTDYKDYGRVVITQNEKDSFNFRVPTLRNIEKTFPYMHDGRFTKLREVISFYTDGKVNRRTLAKELKKPIRMDEKEKKDLIAFLLTLTDTEFLYNPKFAYPKS
ncbi:cytochrome c peroxidase [Flavobacterium sp. SUN046]|uniref:cytochrome-c peroxidase n=1 Tax=Flavobacterium sp. SUN046 TaxID=3002440 RepID=UPI002DBC6633|nr:cytochrome c peroxidase [Flavobacterium sp. SUN046]MEC4048990.1 cytochrome c peroxidase [Flavobacterium sp. SUN046]